MVSNIKRAACLGLTAALATSLMAGCSSSGSSSASSTQENVSDSAAAPQENSYTDYSAGFPERVTIQIPVYDRGYEGWNVTDNYYTRWIQQEFGEKYNVNVEYMAINRNNEVQDFMQLIGAGTAPDIIFHYDMPQAVSYFAQDALQDIDYDEVAYYAPTYWETVKDAVGTYGQLDGHNAFIFAARDPIYYSYVTLIRKDWCDKVGMGVPTTWEELNEVGKAWKEAGLGTIGDQLIVKSFTYMSSWIEPDTTQEELALYYDLNVAPFTWSATENYLRARNEQYNLGIYDPEFYLNTDENMAKSKFISGQSGTFSFYMSNGTDVFSSLLANDPNAEVATMGTSTPPAKGYKSGYYEYPPYGMIMGINAKTSEEERAAIYMLLEWMNQPENLAYLQYGVEGETYTVNEKGIRILNSDYDGEAKMSQNNNKDYWCLVQEVITYGDEELDLEANKTNRAPIGYEYIIQDQFDFAKSREDNGIQIPVFTKSVESSGEYSADLKALWKEAYVDCITCSTEEFDAKYQEYCEEYLEAGYQQILDEKQALIEEGAVVYPE